MNSWYDEYGMVQAEPQPYKAENGLLYTIEEFFLKRHIKNGLVDVDDVTHVKELIEKHQIKKGVFAQNPWDFNDPSSHDNTTAIVIFSKVMGFNFHKDLKILGYYWHPRDIMFYSWLKYGSIIFLLFPFFMPLLFLVFMNTALTEYKGKKPNQIIKTDLEIIYWLRMQLNNSWFMEFCNYFVVPVLQARFGKNWIGGALNIYFSRYGDHPVRVLGNML